MTAVQVRRRLMKVGTGPLESIDVKKKYNMAGIGDKIEIRLKPDKPWIFVTITDVVDTGYEVFLMVSR